MAKRHSRRTTDSPLTESRRLARAQVRPRSARVSLSRIARQIALDTDLLLFFAQNGQRIAALEAIATTRDTLGDRAVLNFLEQHCYGRLEGTQLNHTRSNGEATDQATTNNL
jgi:hypothetical protein